MSDNLLLANDTEKLFQYHEIERGIRRGEEFDTIPTVLITTRKQETRRKGNDWQGQTKTDHTEKIYAFMGNPKTRSVSF